MKTHVMKVAQSFPLTTLRVGVGVIMAAHGAQKFWDLSQTRAGFATLGIPLPSLTSVLAAIGEFGGGVGLILGLVTPIAAALIVVVMACAIAFVHASHGLFARNGGFEYPLTMGLVALYFAFRGGGPISLDALLATRRPSTSVILGRHPSEVGS